MKQISLRRFRRHRVRLSTVWLFICQGLPGDHTSEVIQAEFSGCSQSIATLVYGHLGEVRRGVLSPFSHTMLAAIRLSAASFLTASSLDRVQVVQAQIPFL